MTHKTILITQDQFAKSLIELLSAANETASLDVTARLRFARECALAAQKVTPLEAAWSLAPQAGGSAVLGEGKFDLFNKWGSIFPLIALVAGMFIINQLQDDYRAIEVADVDSALLTDDLPPAAYTDAGFGQFLKLQTER